MSHSLVISFRNNLLLLKKNLSFGRALFTISLRFILDLLAIVRFMNEGKRKDAWAISRAHQSFLRMLFKSEKSIAKSPKALAAVTSPGAVTEDNYVFIHPSRRASFEGLIER